MKFRTKPVVIEAFQMTWDRRWDNSDWPDWLHAAWNGEPGCEGSLWVDPNDPNRERLVLGTLEIAHRVDWGDWIVQNDKGELCLYSPDVFTANYEPCVE